MKSLFSIAGGPLKWHIVAAKGQSISIFQITLFQIIDHNKMKSQ